MKKSSNLFKNTLLYVLTNLFLKSASFLLLPFYSHYISPADFGVFSILLAGYTIVVSFYQGGFQSSFSKFYLEARDDNQREAALSQFFTLTMGISFIASAGCLLASRQLSNMLFSSGRYDTIIQILALTLLFDNFQTCALHVFKTKETIKPVAFFSVVPAVINVTVTIILLVGFGQGIMAIVNAQFISMFVVTAMLIPKIRNIVTWNIDRKYFVLFMKFAIPLMIAGGFTAMTDLVDRFILRHYFDDAMVGIYSFAYRIGNIMMLFVISFRTAWTPHAINLYKKGDYAEHFGRSFGKLLFLSFTIFLSVSLLTPAIFDFSLPGNFHLFNPAYRPGLVIVPIILMAYLFNGLLSFFSIYPYLSGKSWHFLVSDGIALGLNIIGNLLLIPQLGLIGAALATLLSYFGSMLYLWWISNGKVETTINVNSALMLITSAIVCFMVSFTINNLFVTLICLFLFLITGVCMVGVHLLPPQLRGQK